MIRPSVLRPGDTVALVSPAKAIEPELIQAAARFFEEKGFRVLIGAHAAGSHNYFSGTDAERIANLQWAIDHPDVKAIICNRGGYGALRVLQQVQWANFLREPRWLAGFSDITNFHLQGLKLGVETIHSTMPLNFAENTPQSLSSLLSILEHGHSEIHWQSQTTGISGSATGRVIGGNLSIIYSLLGTPLCPSFQDAILFIEDVGEQMYHLDRMFQAMKLAGVFDEIAGLVIGGMTDMKDTATPTNFTVEGLVREMLQFRSIPVAFEAPIGHQNDNQAVIVGRIGHLTVADKQGTLVQSN